MRVELAYQVTTACAALVWVAEAAQSESGALALPFAVLLVLLFFLHFIPKGRQPALLLTSILGVVVGTLGFGLLVLPVLLIIPGIALAVIAFAKKSSDAPTYILWTAWLAVSVILVTGGHVLMLHVAN